MSTFFMFILHATLLLGTFLIVEGGESSLNFLVLGDWGGSPHYPYTTDAEIALSKVMGTKATEISSSFTLALGDNFYDTGVKNVDDRRFKETFEVSTFVSGACYSSISS